VHTQLTHCLAIQAKKAKNKKQKNKKQKTKQKRKQNQKNKQTNKQKRFPTKLTAMNSKC